MPKFIHATKKVGHGKSSRSLLSDIVFEEKQVIDSLRKVINCKRTASDSLLKWAENEENFAIQDVFKKISILSKLWGSSMLEFVNKYSDFRKSFKEILSQEKAVSDLRKTHAGYAAKLSRLQKQLESGSKRKSSVEEEYAQVYAAEEEARAILEVQSMRQEIFKAKTTREALMDLSDTYTSFASESLHVCKAFQKMAESIPDAPTQLGGLQEFKGPTHTQGIIEELADQLHLKHVLKVEHKPLPCEKAIDIPLPKPRLGSHLQVPVMVSSPMSSTRLASPLSKSCLDLTTDVDHDFEKPRMKGALYRPRSLNDLLEPPNVRGPPPVPARPVTTELKLRGETASSDEYAIPYEAIRQLKPRPRQDSCDFFDSDDESLYVEPNAVLSGAVSGHRGLVQQDSAGYQLPFKSKDSMGYQDPQDRYYKLWDSIKEREHTYMEPFDKLATGAAPVRMAKRSVRRVAEMFESGSAFNAPVQRSSSDSDIYVQIDS